MKNAFLILAAIIITANVFAQSPEKMSYQAVIRNSSNALVVSTSVGMQISILQGSPTGILVYKETQIPTTNSNGLISIEIGGMIGFDTINWANGPYFIKTETDPTGGINYTISGTSQLLSVPYALHAKTAENISGGVIETDPVYVASVASGIATADTINWNNKLNIEVDGSTTNEIQALSISNDTVYLSNGGFVKLPAGFDGQYSSLSGAPTNVSSFANNVGYLTSEVDGSTTNEIQALNISNDTVYLSNGGFVKLPPTNAWSITGNVGTNDGTNFIGTTDNVPLTLKVNNEKSGIIKSNGPTFYGYQAGKSNTSISSEGFGYQALYSNTSENYNTAVGYQNLYYNIGSMNVGVGYQSLYRNTSGGANTGIGTQALLCNTTGIYNSALGMYASCKNTTGNHNTAIGHRSLFYSTTGIGNTALGADAGRENVTGSGNVFLGFRAGFHEMGSNKLYIANDSMNPPIIYGDFATGRVGIGTTSPTAKLEVNGAVKIVDGNQALGKVLTSDTNGLASWQSLPAPTPGTVLQMVVATSDSTSWLNTTTFTEANTDYRISFVPKHSNSLFLIEYNFSINTAFANNTIFQMQLIRDIGGTEIPVGIGPINGSRNQTTFSGRTQGYDQNDNQTVVMLAKDQGLTVGTTYTYGFKYRRESGGSGTCYFNYSMGNSSIYGFSGIMTMKITEIAQ